VKEDILKHYGIDIVSIESVAPGSYNEVFLLQGNDDKKYLLKKYGSINNFNNSVLEPTLRVQDYVAQSGLSALIYKTKSKTYSFESDDSIFVLMEFIEGKIHRHKRDVGDSDWRKLAVTMAKIHRLLKGCEVTGLPEAAVSFKAGDFNVEKDLRDEIAKQLDAAEELSGHVSKLAKQPVHGDPTIDNWVFTHDGPVLIDWDTAMNATVERDLLFFDDERTESFLKDYSAVNSYRIDTKALKYYLLTHQLNLLMTRIKQCEAGKIDVKDITKYFLNLEKADDMVAKFGAAV